MKTIVCVVSRRLVVMVKLVVREEQHFREMKRREFWKAAGYKAKGVLASGEWEGVLEDYGDC